LLKGERAGGAVQRGSQAALFFGQMCRNVGLNRIGNAREDLRLIRERRGVNQVAVPGPAA
jgi:hypothetical protein